MKEDNVLKTKTISFSIRIIKLFKFLTESKNEFILSKQLVRSGTAIGALVSESKYAESKADFIHKLHIGLKEASETAYWLLLLKETEFITETQYLSIYKDIEELMKLLTAIITSSKENIKNK